MTFRYTFARCAMPRFAFSVLTFRRGPVCSATPMPERCIFDVSLSMSARWAGGVFGPVQDQVERRDGRSTSGRGPERAKARPVAVSGSASLVFEEASKTWRLNEVETQKGARDETLNVSTILGSHINGFSPPPALLSDARVTLDFVQRDGRGAFRPFHPSIRIVPPYPESIRHWPE